MSDEQLKIEINNFVWMHAPATMPLGEAEKFAVNIWNSFIEARDKYHTSPERDQRETAV